ncbi:MAG: hypothetical protein ACT4PU_13980 [Planctomycetota bacterium]
MRRPRLPAEAPANRLGALRPFLMPAIAAILALFLFLDQDFDQAALLQELQTGRVEEALERLAAAEPGQLPEALAGQNFWPRAERKPAVARLASRGDTLLEEPAGPTILSPRGNLLTAPAELVLREAVTVPLRVELACLDLAMEAGSTALPPGTARTPWQAALIPGSRYLLALHAGDEALLDVANFQLLDGEAATAGAQRLAAARALAGPSAAGAELLMALTELELQLVDAALHRLDALRLTAPEGYGEVLRDLRALALAELGLDRSARDALATQP